MTEPIVPEVCDRLGCRIDSCYGWDLCIEARRICTDEEWDKLWKELFKRCLSPHPLVVMA